eukprot:CAMPEP_0174304060 /NCGR_PEP_ID=MMETSP0809-20121228/60557_1 /TAXON_ID=73025 ORGANISM="Eutreptiella gymnastica-like, Strain CCMP1594" /NCGR_SAMPLE_ID=MMETSP0809 /ASSEMBLY_ACC=CAM_ASM_000658 /LENGTH=52 /DNA_ID=CAMNT_0015410203 /DNA_START=173 /DNA_END=332 /DNA_ORIENTATION=+
MVEMQSSDRGGAIHNKVALLRQATGEPVVEGCAPNNEVWDETALQSARDIAK